MFSSSSASFPSPSFSPLSTSKSQQSSLPVCSSSIHVLGEKVGKKKIERSSGRGEEGGQTFCCEVKFETFRRFFFSHRSFFFFFHFREILNKAKDLNRDTRGTKRRKQQQQSRQQQQHKKSQQICETRAQVR